MSEADLMRQIQVAVSSLGCRIFRNNTGMGWAGKVVRFSKPMTVEVFPGDVVIRKAYPLRAGLIEGSSDLIGWTDKGRFVALEVKTAIGSPTKEQTQFINQVNQSGGIGAIVHSPEEAVEVLNDVRRV